MTVSGIRRKLRAGEEPSTPRYPPSVVQLGTGMDTIIPVLVRWRTIRRPRASKAM